MKKSNIYIIILVILVLMAFVLIAINIKKNIDSCEVEAQAQEVVEKIENLIEKNNKLALMEETNISKENSEQVELAESKINTTKLQEIDEEINGYKVLGIIKIPSIDVNYPILEKTNKESLKLSITKFWGQEINQIGNIVLAGHNNLNNKMFGKINELKNGDVIELTNNQLVTVRYQVFDKYVTNPNDVKCISVVEAGTKEVTLITCIDGNKNRLIVKAREIV